MSKKNLLLLAFSVLWCPSLPAAQDIETIIVKASRIPQPLHTIGSSVSVIDLDDWKGANITIADVLRSVPGIAISQSGGFGQLAALRMRGGESNHTLILLDGVELGNPATGQVDFAHLTTAGIERIEILRGAQSALWGSRAISGVINLISREGGGTTLGLESGSDREQRFSAQTSYRSEWGGIDVGIQNFQTDGDNIAPEGEEEDGYRNTTLQWNLRWTPEPETSLRLSMRQVHATTEYDGFDFAAGHAVDAHKKSKHRRTLLSTDLATRTGPIEHQWNIRYLQTEDHWPGNEPQSQRLQASGLLWRVYDDCLAGRSCTIGGGLEWSKERYTRGEVGPLDFKSASALMILKWQPDTHAFLDLSFRREENQDFGDFNIWRASFAYHLPDQPARVYLTSGIGIANPTLTERYGYSPDQFEGNPGLNPERSRTVEVGFEYYPDGICCRIGLSAFTQRLSDEINGYFDPDDFEGPAPAHSRKPKRTLPPPGGGTGTGIRAEPELDDLRQLRLPGCHPTEFRRHAAGSASPTSPVPADPRPRVSKLARAIGCHHGPGAEGRRRDTRQLLATQPFHTAHPDAHAGGGDRGSEPVGRNLRGGERLPRLGPTSGCRTGVAF